MAEHEPVFVDTGVIMYAGGAPHRLREPCRRLLERVAAGQLRAVTSAEVVQELLHRFVGSAHPEVGRRMASATLDIFAPVLPVTHTGMRRTVLLTERYPWLAARDLVHVATCVEEGLSAIVSPDQGFDGVAELRRIDPHDP